MRYTTLGRTALQVSRLCLGAAEAVLDGGADGPLDAALELGINWWDTTDRDGRADPVERALGRWFAAAPGRRDKVVLGVDVRPPPGRPLSARDLISSCDRSLARLGTGWIDVYQVPTVGSRGAWDEVWHAADVLVHQGKIRYLGVVGAAGWHLVAAQENAARRRRLGLVAQVGDYDPTRREAETELIPAARRYGIGVLARSPLSAALRGRGREVPALPAFRRLCAEAGRDPGEVALAWVLSREGVTAAAVEARTAAELADAVRVLDAAPPADLLARLDPLFPPVGRGGPAPEAWAV
ncbi:aldo/keto reductase [Actinosynnema sp. NPDC023587]|uniref:aldo/keto reductase n=1 Tax=Actinosynnema sp. NPDC023587 TaxID=3154695 RepID=UPI0033D2021F